VKIRKLFAIGAVCLVGSLAAECAAPSVAAPPGTQGLANITQTAAAIGRGGGGGEGGGGNILQVGPKTANILKSIFTPLLFIGTAFFIGVAVVERKPGMAVVVILLAVAIGAFLLEPGQVKETFVSIYRYIL
jgi:hypothetical protein